MIYVGMMECCGVRELVNISYYEPKEILTHLFTYNPIPHCGAYVFTQAGGTMKSTEGYGYDLAAYITENKLGKVTVVPAFRNPNTGRNIHLFVWKFNHAGITRWKAANL